jgi:hypothetical protein
MDQAVSRFSPRNNAFDPSPVHVGFVEEKVALAQIFVQVFQLAFVSIIAPVPHKHLSVATSM